MDKKISSFSSDTTVKNYSVDYKGRVFYAITSKRNFHNLYDYNLFVESFGNDLAKKFEPLGTLINPNDYLRKQTLSEYIAFSCILKKLGKAFNKKNGIFY